MRVSNPHDSQVTHGSQDMEETGKRRTMFPGRRKSRRSRSKSTSNKRVASHTTFFACSKERVCCDDVKLQRHAKHNDLVTITRSLMCCFEITMTRMFTALLEHPAHTEKLEMKIFQLQRRSLETMFKKMKTTALTSRCLQGHRNCTGLLKLIASRSRVSSPAGILRERIEDDGD